MAELATRPEVMQVLRSQIPDDLVTEMSSVSATGVDLRALMLGNATYDLVKFGIGCSAVAVDTAHGPLHGRNLDWFAPDNVLAHETLLCRYINAPAGEFTSVAWPGFLGVLSGIAPGRFSITLNAVFSNDPPVPRCPVALMLRQVFEEAPDFSRAVERLAHEPLSTDCLLLVVGVRAGEMVVIERTPSRYALRKPAAGSIQVTNDYVDLAADVSVPVENDIHRTSCGRFERLRHLLAKELPTTAEAMRRMLQDTQVQMPITVQRMLFSAARGLCEVEPVVQPTVW